MKLRITCETGQSVPLNLLNTIQGEMKEISPKAIEKLLNSFESNGFCDPFGVWDDNGRKVLLSGNQRLKALQRAKELGWELPQFFPAFEVKAESEKEAAEKLLAMASSYGDVNPEKVESFCNEFEVDFEKTKQFTRFYDKQDADDSSKKTNNSEDDKATGSLEYINIPFNKENFPEAKQAWDDLCDKLISESEALQTPTDVFEYLVRQGEGLK